MALNDFLALTDDGLKAEYEAKAPDTKALRNPFIKSLNTAINQFENNRTRAPNRMWSGSGKVVKFTPKVSGKPVKINGKVDHYVPTESFVEVVKELIDAVEKGEMDQAILEAKASTVVTSGAKAKSRPLSELTPDERQKAANKIPNRSRKAGKSDDDIRQRMTELGYTKGEIENALKVKAKAK